MKAKAWLLVLFAACALSAAPRKIFPYEYVQEDLPNGLRLVSIPTDAPKIVAVYIVVQTGSRNEIEPGKSGFAHLFEHMMFRGTEKFPPEKYQAVLTRAGASQNAYTSDDLTVYHTTFSNDDLEAVLMMEADRFQNLKYAEGLFKTETRAVLGEYNKNSANPVSKLFEVMRAAAFKQHTYRHTTMGFLKDIEDMPNQYEYSLEFFRRWYRPEYVTVIVAGDIEPKRVRAMVDKYWGPWKRGDYKVEIPAEPPQDGPRTASVEWPTPTLPWIAIGFRAPAYTDETKESAALDVLSQLYFSENSELYQKLVIEEQKVDVLSGGLPDHVDPYLFTVFTRVKKPADMDAVRDRILAAVKQFSATAPPLEKLEKVKNNLRYSFAMGMDNTESVAGIVARFVALRRTPATIDKIYELYSQVTPEDVRAVAAKYLNDTNRTIVTLTAGGAR